MTGVWLASYIALWILMVAVCLLLTGLLRQVGIMQQQIAPVGVGASPEQPPLENDGPAIGSGLPQLASEPLNDYPLPNRRGIGDRAKTLLLCISPMCESCQHIVDPLNAILEDGPRPLQAVVVMRADEQACRAFLSVFPLRAPVLCDADRSTTMSLGVHRNPLGLLYDERGVLIRKGVVTTRDELLALLGDPTAPADARAHMFPREGPPEAIVQLSRV